MTRDYSFYQSERTDFPEKNRFPFSESIPETNRSRLTPPEDELDRRYQLQGAPDAQVSIQGRDYLYFSGSGYLCHQVNPDIMATTCESILLYGLSSARLKRQYLPKPILQVGRTAAHFFGTENALYTSGCRESLQILLLTLAESFDKVFIDEYCHDYIFETLRQLYRHRLNFSDSENKSRLQQEDGTQRSRKKRNDLNLECQTLCFPKIITFSHRSCASLQNELESNLEPGERPLVITEGIFPLFGTIAPLADYFDLLAQYDHPALLLDDSHALGVLGTFGRGSLEHFHFNTSSVNRSVQDRLLPELSDLTDGIDFQKPPIELFWTASLAKAVGGMGSIIPGSRLFIDRLLETMLQYGHEALSTPGAAASVRGLEILGEETTARKKLWNNVKIIKRGLLNLGINTEANEVPIIGFKIGSSATMRQIQRRLADEGILISYIPRRQGVGSQGMLRLTVSTNHEEAMLQRFLTAFDFILKNLTEPDTTRTRT